MQYGEIKLEHNINAKAEQVICTTLGACPFAPTEESEIVQNYGCLPTRYEIRQMRIKHGKSWACHKDHSKPCLGAILDLKEHGHDYKVNELIAEEDAWDEYVDS